jgi:hypothetical protein
MGFWHRHQDVGIWVYPEEFGAVYRHWQQVDVGRTGRYGARAARTAPLKVVPNSPLKVDRLPAMNGVGVTLCDLSGSFRNDLDKETKIEVTTPLPDVFFPGGAASRTFTARPKAVTPYKIPMLLIHRVTKTALAGRRLVDVQVRAPGGGMLAHRPVLLAVEVPFDVKLENPMEVKPTAIDSLDGGPITLRIFNACDRSRRVNIQMPAPPGVKLRKTELDVQIAAGATAKSSFVIPPQVFCREGVCPLPYRISVDNGKPQTGRARAELSNRSRWWMCRQTEKAPTLEALEPDALVDDIMPDMGGISSEPQAVFKAAKMPKGWKVVIGGASTTPLNSVGGLPEGALGLAATRVIAPAKGQALVKLRHSPQPQAHKEPLPRFQMRLWINDDPVFDGESVNKKKQKNKPPEPISKSVRLRKGVNTLLVQYHSKERESADPGTLWVEFQDPITGKPLPGLVFDMRKR